MEIKNTPFYQKTLKAVQSHKAHTVFVHTDLMLAFDVRIKPFTKYDLGNEHINLIAGLTQNSHLWLPSFNYDFTSNGVYHINEDSSQVGFISDHFRLNFAEWRNEMPVFNICGTGPKLPVLDTRALNCFGLESFFHELYLQNALILHYGSPFPMSMTIIHYCEFMSQNLLYRYNKNFKGTIINKDNTIANTTLTYHVRPISGGVAYDWSKLKTDLEKNNILHTINDGKRFICLLNARQLVDYLVDQIKQNPLYLLNEASIIYVNEKLHELGRKFELTDFEKN